jgi:hypothetical protein
MERLKNVPFIIARELYTSTVKDRNYPLVAATAMASVVSQMIFG